MSPRRIVIDGKTYTSIDEMPADVREQYEQAMSVLKDRDRDGVPDILEDGRGSSIVTQTTRIVVDGKEYDGIQDLPPEVRARYEGAIATLDANRNGTPDLLEGTVQIIDRSSTQIEVDADRRSARRFGLRRAAQDSAPDTSNGWLLALAGLLGLSLCLGLVAVLWFGLPR